MTGYTRQSIFTSGDVIKAEHGNDEFDQVAAAFAQATGHTHSGASSEGAYVPLISDTTATNKVEIITGGARTTGNHDVTGNITVTGTVDGRDIATDGTTLDTAVTDITSLENDKVAKAGDTMTGNLTVPNLITAGNVDGRDVSVDGTTLDTAVTDISNLESDKYDKTGGLISGNITITGTVDGRDVSTDGTKLDTIETSAKDDQVASEVPFTPAGGVSSTDVQAAIQEVNANIATEIAAKVHYNEVVDVAVDYSVTESNDGNMLQIDTAGGNVSLTLPDSTSVSEDIRFSVVKYSADSNTVTVNASGTDTINGGSSQVISKQYEHVNILLDKDDGEWIAAGGVVNQIPASSVTVTPTGELDSTDTQAALEELFTDKANRSGDTFTGEITVDLNTATPGYLNGHLELKTTDSSDVSVGFNREGFSACQLRHESNGLVLSGNGRTVPANLHLYGDITVDGTVDGRDVSVDGTKLDTIETNAKDDQIASEVPFTPYSDISSTNVQTAIQELQDEKVAKSGDTMTGNLTVPNLITSGNVDGRDVSADGAKLDGIESGATADQSAAEILSIVAGASVGAVGSYAFIHSADADTAPGSTRSASNLFYSNAGGEAIVSVSSGTWRCMGDSNSSGNDNRTTLWLRIS